MHLNFYDSKNFISLSGQEEGSRSRQARHRQEVEENVPQGRSGSFHWRPHAETFVRWKTRNRKNRSSLIFFLIKITLFSYKIYRWKLKNKKEFYKLSKSNCLKFNEMTTTMRFHARKESPEVSGRVLRVSVT